MQGSNAPSRGLYARLVAVPAIWGGTFIASRFIARAYYQAVQRLGAARTEIFTNLVPVFGAGFGVLLLGEPLLPSMLPGGAVAVAGVMMVSR